MKKGLILLLLLLPTIALAASTLQDGLYRDQADGYGGKVIVTVTIRNGRLTEITTENTGGEKSEYYLKAEEVLTQEILSRQTLDGIDTVAGATGTSESILTAMRGVWEQAQYDGKAMEPQSSSESAPQPAV